MNHFHEKAHAKGQSMCIAFRTDAIRTEHVHHFHEKTHAKGQNTCITLRTNAIRNRTCAPLNGETNYKGQNMCSTLMRTQDKVHITPASPSGHTRQGTELVNQFHDKIRYRTCALH